MKHTLRGAMTALVTPFKEDGSVDYEGFRENVRFQIKEGIQGLIPLGTTGESPTIHPDEREQIIKICVEESDGNVPIIVGTGTNSTEKTIKITAQAKELGADAALIVTPYYNKPTQEGIYRHFKAIADATEFPIIVYNIKGRTGVNIETPTLKRMSQIKYIVGVKEASGDINQMGDVIEELPASFAVLSGDDSMTLPLMSLGGHGVISVVSNLVPAKVVQMVNYALLGEFDKARNLHFELLPLFKGMFIETNPVPIKEAMNMAGMSGGTYRLPMCEMKPENREKVRNLLKECGIIK